MGRTYLSKNGVPVESIVIESEGESTAQSSIAVAEIMQRMGLRSCIVVSDGYHIYRAKKMLQERGLILTQQQQRVIWTGGTPTVKPLSQPSSPAPGEPHAQLVFPADDGAPAAADGDPSVLSVPARWASWLADVLHRSQPDAPQRVDLAELKRSFPTPADRPPAPPLTDQLPFKDFLHTPVWQALLERGLALV